jgi:signal transduction histidine kinase
VPRTALWLRVFVGLLVAVLPPILLLLAAALLAEEVLHSENPNLVAAVVFIGSLLWAGILAIVFTGRLADEFRSFLSIAETGSDPESAEARTAYQQLASTLDERNRQVSALAQQSSLVPIDDDPRAVVGSLVSAVRVVMRDPTWRLAVLSSTPPELLPAGVYHAAEDGQDPEPIGEMERWASVTEPDRPARWVEGPWGAFVVIDVAVSDRMRAVLYAPWQGRVEPTPAEFGLFNLVGQHAGTALEHSLLYAQVRSQADELTRLAAVQADFLRGVTHDLQTPLTSIGALATELHANEAVPQSARPDLESISHQAERLRRMVSQLLVASRLEAGVLTPQQEVFAVPPLVERTWSALRSDRPFELDVEGPAHLAIADPDRLEQVLWAVLDNAVKYSPAGSPIDVTIAPDGDHLGVTVSDRGTGMDETTRAKAFDQFYRSDQARKLAPDGSGVGLYAARGLMEAMGGSIEIASQLGQGAAITLRVPAEPSVAAAD